MNITSLFEFDIKLYNFLLIPKIILTVLKNYKAVKLAKKNKNLKNSVNGGTVYICGNGPSLKKVDLNNINADYIVVNDFYKFEKKNPNNPPKFYMILDEDFLKEELQDRFQGVFNPGFETTYVLNGLLEKRVSKEFSNLSPIYFCPWGQLYSSRKLFKFDCVHGRTWNVICEAILFAMYLGYNEIRLLGCDYSVFATNAHFYPQIQKRPKLQGMLYKYCYTTQVHYEIAKYALQKKVRIINMTKDTLLDAYMIDENSSY